MKTVAVIIPYYQREPGLLRRAVESIALQQVSADTVIDVIIADDESPSPPEPEVHGLSRDRFNIRIVKRENGGPAKARNSALDAAGDVDFIAFLDSDDWWEPGHLATAIEMLEQGAGFYFANSYDDPGTTWFQALINTDELIAASNHHGNELYNIENKDFLPLLLAECVAHTSTVVFNAREVPGCRFDEQQSHGGEDYLYWIYVVSRTARSAYSKKPMTVRGRGIDLCRAAYDWSNPQCGRRLYFDILSYRKLIRSYCQTDEQRRQVAAIANRVRQELLHVLMRNSIVHFRSNMWVWGRLLRHDPAFFVQMPYNLSTLIRRRLHSKPNAPSAETNPDFRSP